MSSRTEKITALLERLKALTPPQPLVKHAPEKAPHNVRENIIRFKFVYNAWLKDFRKRDPRGETLFLKRIEIPLSASDELIRDLRVLWK